LDALRHKKTYEQKLETQAAPSVLLKRSVVTRLHGIPAERFTHFTAQRSEAACQIKLQWQGFVGMKVAAIVWMMSCLWLWTAFTQTPAADKAQSSEATRLEALEKKIDQQNAKIDALSQEILKLEQQLLHIRPGVMIGEAAPASANAPASHSTAGGNTHTVARGETLTSIAKMYKVTVDELQQANHIEDGRRLQAGQTIVIPTPSPAASGSASP
jgi:LysM repeat protein